MPTADWPPIEGGISTVAYETARELAAMGHEVTVVAPYFPDMRPRDTAEPVRVLRFHGYGAGWFRVAPMLVKTWPLIKDTDLVLAINASHGGLIAWLARGFHKKPYVTFAYAYEFMRFRRTPVFRELLRDIYEDSAFVCAISAFTAKNLEEFGVRPELIELNRPGAPLAAKVGEEEVTSIRQRLLLGDGPILLSAGRLVPRKGHVTIVEALPAVLESFPNAVVVMAGRGPAVSDASRRAAELGVRDSIRMPGYVSDTDLAALYTLCDVFVLPAGADDRGQVEGFGLVFLEANAYGKPVIGGRSGGTPDAVLDGVTGLLIEPNDPVALAGAVLRLLNNPAESRRLGERGRERARTEFTWRRFCESLTTRFKMLPTS